MLELRHRHERTAHEFGSAVLAFHDALGHPIAHASTQPRKRASVEHPPYPARRGRMLEFHQASEKRRWSPSYCTMDTLPASSRVRRPKELLS